MPNIPPPSLHDDIKYRIEDECRKAGFISRSEYKGKDWRADVFASNGTTNYAFEVQISPQSLKRTIERQKKFIRDSVVGCWLFEKTPSKLWEERPDLPLFTVKKDLNTYLISLGDRKTLEIGQFLSDYLNAKIRFCQSARMSRTQRIEVVFYEMECWKCKTLNHIYYVDPEFRSACNAKVRYEEAIWDSDKVKFFPEILSIVDGQAKANSDLRLAIIKDRFSKTVGHSYLSFGCLKCDSIFGDWFVRTAEMDAHYGDGVVSAVQKEVEIDIDLVNEVPHWCHPGGQEFCD